MRQAESLRPTSVADTKAKQPPMIVGEKLHSRSQIGAGYTAKPVTPRLQAVATTN